MLDGVSFREVSRQAGGLAARFAEERAMTGRYVQTTRAQVMGVQQQIRQKTEDNLRFYSSISPTPQARQILDCLI